MAEYGVLSLSRLHNENLSWINQSKTKPTNKQKNTKKLMCVKWHNINCGTRIESSTILSFHFFILTWCIHWAVHLSRQPSLETFPSSLSVL